MTRDIEAEIARLRPYASESVLCATRINWLERELELTRAGSALRAARVDAAVALSEARNAALRAHTAGVSERTIADLLDVNRTTVRRWLGKPRD
jgi:hypothetical protein